MVVFRHDVSEWRRCLKPVLLRVSLRVSGLRALKNHASFVIYVIVIVIILLIWILVMLPAALIGVSPAWKPASL